MSIKKTKSETMTTFDLSWNWGGVMTTEDEVITMPSRIRGIERFAVAPDHPAYNSSVGLLLEDNDTLKKILEGGIKAGEIWLIRGKAKNRTDV